MGMKKKVKRAWLICRVVCKVIWKRCKKQIICLTIGLALLITGIVGFSSSRKEYKQNDEFYETITDSYTSIERKRPTESTNESKKNKAKAEEGQSALAEGNTVSENEGINEEASEDITYESTNFEGEWFEWINVDFKGLKKVNRDIIGWIFFENEDISYPVLAGGDNNEYLRTNMTHDSATAGSIFIDCENEIDFNDAHTIIYGHNMKDLSMFGKLKYYYKDAGYYDNHKYFQIITKDKVLRYEIVSYKQVVDNDSIYYVIGSDRTGFNSFAKNQILGGSMIESPIEITDDEYIITLSTCSTSGDERFVVSAVRIDEHSYN